MKPIKVEIEKRKVGLTEGQDVVDSFAEGLIALATMGIAHKLMPDKYVCRVTWDDGTVIEGYGNSEAEAREQAMKR